MKIERNTPQIEKAAALKESRYSITSVWLTEIKPGVLGELAATDGRICAVLPVELDCADTAGPLPPSALKAARKAAKPARVKDGYPVPNTARPAELRINGQAEVIDPDSQPVMSCPRGDADVTFPAYHDVIPAKTTSKGVLEIALSAGALLRLAQAITDKDSKVDCGYAVRLQFATADDGTIDAGYPIRVDPISTREGLGFGAIMPVNF